MGNPTDESTPSFFSQICTKFQDGATSVTRKALDAIEGFTGQKALEEVATFQQELEQVYAAIAFRITKIEERQEAWADIASRVEALDRAQQCLAAEIAAGRRTFRWLILSLAGLAAALAALTLAGVLWISP